MEHSKSHLSSSCRRLLTHLHLPFTFKCATCPRWLNACSFQSISFTNSQPHHVELHAGEKKLDIVFFLSISGIIRSLWIAFVNLQCRMLTYRRPQQLTSPHSNNLQSTGTDHIVSAHRTRRTNRTDWTNGNISNKTIEIPMPGGPEARRPREK